jgi:hypothetical protein
MRIRRVLSWLLLASASAACDSRSPGARREPATEDVARSDSSAGRKAAGDTLCATPPGGLRIGIDSVAGMPADAPVGELRRRCARAWEDDYGIGRSVGSALVFPFRGGRVRAVQSSLEMNRARPADLWVAEGDSLRMTDGSPVPRTIGDLRARYPHGFVTADKRDDSGDGVQAFTCRYPQLVFGLWWDVTTPADTGHWALASRAVSDTAAINRVEMWTDPDARRARLCAATSDASGR